MTLIISFTFIYIKLKNTLITKKFNKVLLLALAASLTSFLSVLTMGNPFEFSGYRFDLRSVPIFVVSYTMGWKIGLISSILPILYRWSVSGNGAWYGISQGIILPILIGSYFGHHRNSRRLYEHISIKNILKAFIIFSLTKDLLVSFTLGIPPFEAWVISASMTGFSILTLLSIVIIINDSNKREISEKNLRISEERYKKLVEMLPDGVIVYREDEIVMANTAAAELMGVDRKALVKSPENSTEARDADKEVNEIIAAFVQRKIASASIQHQFLLNNGREIDVEIRAISLTSEGEDFVINLLRDISSIKRAQRLEERMKQEKKLYDEIVEYDRLKTEFFANLSHELKTPLNLLYSTVQLLDIEASEKQCIDSTIIHKRTKVFRQNCCRMIKLTNNLIDITKIDSGYFTLELQPCNIVSIVEEITLSVAEYIKNHDIDLVFDTDVEEKIIPVDPNAMERIILNLLSNAIKFSKANNEITINLYDHGEYVIISVKDKGQGIPKDKVDVIFERFRQADKLLNRRYEGSGIGLSLVKGLVTIHGGEISVESEYGEGSEFIIKLPAVSSIEVVDKGPRDELKSKYVESINIEFSDIYT